MGVWRIVAVASALVGITGCGGMQREQARQAFETDKEACRSAIPKQIGNYERFYQYEADAMEKDLSPVAGPDGFRLGQIEAHLILVGQEVDQRRITPEEGRADIADYTSGIVSESQEAATQRQEAATASMAASAQLLGASAALTQAARPTYVAPQAIQLFKYQAPVNTACTQTGAFTNCTTQ